MVVDPDKLYKIIHFIQKCENGSYHPIKKKYKALADFIQDRKQYVKGRVYDMSAPRKNFTKELPDNEQVMYHENIFYLKEYISFRFGMEERRSEFKTITFAPDFSSIRVGR